MDREGHYHFVGIGGIGMSALAHILLEEEKVAVSGSDAIFSAIIEKLSEKGAKITLGHHAEVISKNMTVVVNSMVGNNNVEWQKAEELSCPIIHRSDLLWQMADRYETLAVTGSHGKSTTSALLAELLLFAGKDPTFALGATFCRTERNGGLGKGNYFVIEADESDRSFAKGVPFGAIVTNIDFDHIENYGSFEHMKELFLHFMQKVKSPEHLIWCFDNEELRSIAPFGISYGFCEGADAKLSHYFQKGWKSFFDLSFKGICYRAIEMPLIGKHSAQNGAAVFVMGLQLGLSEEVIREGLKQFGGIKRRLEPLLDAYEIKIIDDYGHHPNEITKTLHAIASADPLKKRIVLFEPHRYTRFKSCYEGFLEAFDLADELIVTDIYSAFETKEEGASVKAFADKLHAKYIPKEELFSFLTTYLRPHDALIGFNAGDVSQILHEVANYFKTHAPVKLKVALLAGGASVEHEISLVSADNVYRSLDPQIYEAKKVIFPKTGIEPVQMAEILDSDIAQVVLHGPYGEDGTIQGMLELFDKPYTGGSPLFCALAMDKGRSKQIVQNAKIKTAPFLTFSYDRWLASQEQLCEEILHKFTFPLMVKASHLGSSVGVIKVDKQEELLAAIKEVFGYDTHLVVEKFLVGREIEFSVLGTEEPFVAVPGEVLTGGALYDYEAKYGAGGMKAEVPARLSETLVLEGKQLAKEIYLLLGGEGFARIDFFLCEEEKGPAYYFSEVNPIPGMTSISVYPKAFSSEGMTNKQLMDQMIAEGLKRARNKKRCLKSFSQ